MIRFNLADFDQEKTYTGTAGGEEICFRLKKARFFKLVYIEIYAGEGKLKSSMPLAENINPFERFSKAIRYTRQGQEGVFF